MSDYPTDIEQNRRMDTEFNQETWRFRSKILTSESAQKLIDMINQASLTQACKQALSGAVYTNFDPNAFLARTENLLIRKIILEEQLNVAVTAYSIADTMNPELLNIETAIRVAFFDIVSRSVGGKERDSITKSETISQQNYSGLPPSPGQPQPEQRGFKLPFFGK